MYVFLQNSHAEIRKHDVMVLVSVAFRGCLSHESGAFVNGICAFIKEILESFLAGSTTWVQKEMRALDRKRIRTRT